MRKINNVMLSHAGLLTLSIAAATVQAQQTSPLEEEILITGYRASLLNSTEAKRNSVGFSDEIFSDDIGKMPSQNLAESLARIPGVRINREVTGEGQQISVRGLGSDFTRVVMNGNSIAVASDGSLGAGQKGRHIDLDMFPTELFSSLSVNKTTSAHHVEGGVSGYVDMRTMRASDMGDGVNFRFGLEAAYNDMSGKTSPKLNAMFGYDTDKFGILVGLVGRQSKTRTDGYETVGDYQSGCVAEFYATPDAGGNTRGCVAGSTGWNVFNYSDRATPDYVAVHGGNVGDALDLNAVSGLTDEQLDNFRMPYITRPMFTYGDRDSTSGILSLQYRPTVDIEVSLDVVHAEADRSFVRNELMNIYRRNYIQYGLEWIPENIRLNYDGVLQSGTFYNSRAWVGSRAYDEELSYTAIMPSLHWRINDVFQVDVSASTTESDFDRDEPYLLYYSPAGVMTHDFGSDMPEIHYSVDVASAGPGWTFGAGPGVQGDETQNGEFRFQRNSRSTETSTFKMDLAFGEDAAYNGIKFGVHWDEASSDMTGYSGGDPWTDRVRGSDLNSNFINYMVDSPIDDLSGDGIRGIAGVNWGAVKRAVDYGSFVPDASAGGDQFGSTVGDIEESILAIYLEGNGEGEVAGRLLRTNIGVRLVDTEQTVEANGLSKTSDYSRILPSFNAVYSVTESLKLRTSASRSLTRANPSSMFPSAAWNGSGIDEVAVGNYQLQPFESTNFDLGGEWYFGDVGMVGLNYYEKDITGFVKERNTQVQFNQLEAFINDYGYDFEITEETLSQTQLDALDNCGGWDSENCMTNVSDDVNIEGVTKLTGWEVIWVMPLDFLVEGLGFNASMNKIDQDASDPDGEIFGISDTTNFTAYYENTLFQTRITYTLQEGSEVGGGWSPLLGEDRQQLDLSASYELPVLTEYNLSLSLDAYNLTNEPMQSVFESDGNTFSIHYPGATFTLGLRARF